MRIKNIFKKNKVDVVIDAKEWYKNQLKKRAKQAAVFSVGVLGGSCVLKFAPLPPMAKVGVGIAVVLYDLTGSMILTAKSLDDLNDYLERVEKEEKMKKSSSNVEFEVVE